MNRAIVYFDSLLGEDGDAEILEALGEHRVRIQGSVGRQVRAKKTPILSFKPDEVDPLRPSASSAILARHAPRCRRRRPSRARRRRRLMARRRPPTIHGLAVVDKPAGVTSHDVVGMMRRHLDERQVGHAGTLDPDATGVLLVGVGNVTRLLRFLTALGKTYTAEVVFGTETTTLDASGEVTGTLRHGRRHGRRGACGRGRST